MSSSNKIETFKHPSCHSAGRQEWPGPSALGSPPSTVQLQVSPPGTRPGPNSTVGHHWAPPFPTDKHLPSAWVVTNALATCPSKQGEEHRECCEVRGKPTFPGQGIDGEETVLCPRKRTYSPAKAQSNTRAFSAKAGQTDACCRCSQAESTTGMSVCKAHPSEKISENHLRTCSFWCHITFSFAQL